jgi:hypothetical protein
MMKKLLLLSMICLAATAGYGQTTNRLHFPATGFSIAPLEAPAGQATQRVLMMFLPEKDGFAPNVNVQLQRYSGTMEEYLALTLQESKTNGLKVLQQQTTGKSLVVLEYAGELEGRALHWYARAVKTADGVYLATATATDEQWSRLAEQLKACVNSLQWDSIERRAAPSQTSEGR